MLRENFCFQLTFFNHVLLQLAQRALVVKYSPIVLKLLNSRPRLGFNAQLCTNYKTFESEQWRVQKSFIQAANSHWKDTPVLTVSPITFKYNKSSTAFVFVQLQVVVETSFRVSLHSRNAGNRKPSYFNLQPFNNKKKTFLNSVNHKSSEYSETKKVRRCRYF